MPELAYVNGTLSSIEEARVPIEDRGYQFGDAVYEFLATYHGNIFAMQEHMERLERSLRMLQFPALDLEKVERDILDLLHRSGIARAGIYIQISRGVAPRNHLFPNAAEPQIIMTVRHAADVPETVRNNGAKAITVADIRWGHCDIKTVQLLPNALAKQQAFEAGANDAIFISPQGNVREGTSSNLFMVRSGELYTHPLTHEILPGVTRKFVVDICREEKITVHEALFDKQQLMTADEVFLTGTVTEVLPVVVIDGNPIGGGRPGEMSRNLMKLLRKRAGA